MGDQFPADESFTGLLRRVADAQGYSHLADFNRRIGFGYGRPMIENLEAVAQAIDLSSDHLAHLAPALHSEDPCREWRFDRTHSDPFCPLCLREGHYWRKEWRHALISACSVHATRLVDRCAVCNEVITPKTGGLQTCGCGQTLADHPAEPATHGEAMLARILANDEHVSLCGILASGDKGLARSIWFLASGFEDARTGKSGKSEVPKTVAETLDFLKPVVALIDDWPNNFDRHVVARWNVGTGQTATQRLGSWYRGLMRLDGSVGNAFRERCKVVVRDQCGASYASREEAGASEWVSASEAARQIGIRADRLVDAVAAKKIEGRLHRSGSGHRHTMVPAKVIAKIIADRMISVTALEVMDYLAVTKPQFALLRAAGVLRTHTPDTRPALTEGDFDFSAIKRNVEMIAAGTNETRAQRTSLPFSALTLRRTTDRTALLSLYDAIFTGSVKPVSADSAGHLGAFCFALDDIERFLTTAAPTTMTARDVARATGWKHETVTHWCDLGLLQAQRQPRGQTEVWCISHSALAEFQSHYIPLASLSRQMKTSPRKLIADLRAAKIDMLGAKAVGATCRGNLVRIADLAKIVMS